MGRKFMVIVVQYEERDERIAENLVESVTETIKAEHGKIRSVYKGLEEHITSALERILNLTK